MLDIAVDGYLREQDLVNLLVEDCIGDNGAFGLMFGRARRGDSSKTGRDQGVVLDEPWSGLIIQKRTAGRKPKERAFGISADSYRLWWDRAAEAAGGGRAQIGPPHTARHTGPSCDLSTSYRTLDSIMKRGRWKAVNSVHRYAKPHAWLAACQRQDPELRAKGAAILARRGLRPSVARA